MSKIIKLEDGQLVAEDPDNGERVPVSFEALEAESLDIGDDISSDDDIRYTHDGSGAEWLFKASGAFGTERIGDVIYAAYADGDDADERLDNAVPVAEDGDTIVLEKAEYTTDRTFEGHYTITGTGGLGFAGAEIAGTWTIDGRTHICRLIIPNSGHLVFDNTNAVGDIIGVYGLGDITVSADEVGINNITGSGSVTFEDGTTGGDLGVVTGDVTVTDNGSNLS